jgi:VWFA-related protein
MPGFSETNVFDALYDTLDRVDGIEGRKYVILVSRGIDTFSKITLDRALKKIKDTRDVTIFTISTGQALRMWAESRNLIGPITSLDFLQADNQMKHFASMTGGRWYNPRFEGELPAIFREIAAITRNQYTLAYKPTNSAQDGTYRKIKNEKQKEVKVQIIAREGYTARRTVERNSTSTQYSVPSTQYLEPSLENQPNIAVLRLGTEYWVLTTLIFSLPAPYS